MFWRCIRFYTKLLFIGFTYVVPTPTKFLRISETLHFNSVCLFLFYFLVLVDEILHKSMQ